MSITGLCEVCGSQPATDRCSQCGTIACERHYRHDAGLCVSCASQADPTRHDDVGINRF